MPSPGHLDVGTPTPYSVDKLACINGIEAGVLLKVVCVLELAAESSQ